MGANHLPECNVGKARICPSLNTLHVEAIGDHWWSGWPGAYCVKCHDEDPRELCLADNCACTCHPVYEGE